MKITFSKSLILLALIGTFIQPSQASGQDEDTALIWRGFTHEWETRNHRIGRLGSWVSSVCWGSGCSGSAHHTATVGSAADSASFRTSFTEISSSVASFQVGTQTIAISGTEGRLIEGTEHVRIPANSSGMRSRDRYVALLNGFDLKKEASEAKKFDRLKILVRNLRYDSGFLELEIDWAFKADCDSMECLAWKPALEYELEVKFLMVAGDLGGVRFSNDNPKTNYTWNKTVEPSVARERMSSTINPIGSSYAYQAGTVGIRGFNLNLDRDYHMMKMAIGVSDIRYDPIHDFVRYEGDAFFGQWTREMTTDIFTFRKAGKGLKMELWTTLLEFTEAEIDDNRSANGVVSSVREAERVLFSF